MNRNTYIVAGVLSFVLLAASVGGWLGYRYYQNKQLASQKTAASPYTLGDSTESSSKDSGESTLGVNQLNVASDLGQLDLSGGQQSTSGNNSSSEKQSNPFDPATYKQYDKYKESQSGLFAEVLKGDGAEVVNGKKVAVYYKGWLTDGTLFDQSEKNDKGELQPFVFEMGAKQVIPGWEQALAGMKVGGVRLVIVPPAVGYGAQAQGAIPPNSVLIFQVQLAAVQ